MTTVRISGGVVHNLPADLRKAIASDAKALVAWEDITPVARNEVDLLDHLRQER
jgi:hypothetical protein